MATRPTRPLTVDLAAWLKQQARLKSMLAAEKLSTEGMRAMEDYVAAIIDGWDELRQATAYCYLHAQGMNLQKAHEIRVKAGLSD